MSDTVTIIFLPILHSYLEQIDQLQPAIDLFSNFKVVGIPNQSQWLHVQSNLFSSLPYTTVWCLEDFR